MGTVKNSKNFFLVDAPAVGPFMFSSQFANIAQFAFTWSTRRKFKSHWLTLAFTGRTPWPGLCAIAVVSEIYLKSEYTQPEWAAAFAQDPTGPFQGIGPHPGLQPETGKTIDANERIKVLEIRPPFPPGNPPDVRDASVWIRFQRLSWPKPVAS